MGETLIKIEAIQKNVSQFHGEILRKLGEMEMALVAVNDFVTGFKQGVDNIKRTIERENLYLHSEKVTEEKAIDRMMEELARQNHAS